MDTNFAPPIAVAVVGSLNYDLVVPVERFPLPGETILGGNHYGNAGGKGANQAVAAARLGQHVAMIGRIGEDQYGQALLSNLTTNRVDTEHVTVTPGVATGVAFIQVNNSGENSIVVSPGANALLAPDDAWAASSILEGSGALLLQLEIPLETVSTAASLAAGIVILNPAPAKRLPQELLDQVDVLVPNKRELATLLDTKVPNSITGIARLAKRVVGPKAVVVTLGGQGALVVRSNEVTHVPPSTAKMVDTTAAGDCFCGALADALARGSDLLFAARWAAQAAALTVARSGAQDSMPRRHELKFSPSSNNGHSTTP